MGTAVVFEEEIERLGMAAVAAKGTEDYPAAFRKLMVYFKDGYYFYLLEMNQMSAEALNHERDFDKTVFVSDKSAEVDDCYFNAISSMDDRLSKAVKNYDAEKAGGGKTPFCTYMMGYFYSAGKQYASEQRDAEKRGTGMIPFRSRSEKELLHKVLSFCRAKWSTDDLNDLEEREIREIAAHLNIKRETLDDILRANSETFAVRSIALSENEEWLNADNSESTPPDESRAIGFQAFQNHEDLFEKWLRDLNRIYDESFLELHRAVFPPCMTSDYIKAVVEDVLERSRRVDEYDDETVRSARERTLQSTIDNRWDELMIEHRKETYANGQYRCISEYVFSSFELERRIIQRKMIAHWLGMKAPRLTKAFDDAMEVVRRHMKGDSYLS